MATLSQVTTTPASGEYPSHGVVVNTERPSPFPAAPVEALARFGGKDRWPSNERSALRESIRLGRFAGVPIGLHWSVAVIVALLTISLSGTILPDYAPGYGSVNYLMVAVMTGGLFIASIAAHELGHSVVAVRNGVGVRGITLFALGGVARLDGEAPDAGAAARIAAAGPAVSVAIGLATLAVAEGLSVLGGPALAVAGVAWLGLINLVLAVFNLLPALPLDGGRLLQALLWKRSGDRDQATITAATVGRYGGWGLVLLGLWQTFQGGFGLWTMVIGGFLIMTARTEELRARIARRVGRSGPNPWGDPGRSGHNPWDGFRPDDGSVIDVGPGRERSAPGRSRRPGDQEQPGERQDGDIVGTRRIGLVISPFADLGEPLPVMGTEGVEDRP